MIRSRRLAVPHGFGDRSWGDCGLGSGDPDAAANRAALAHAALPGATLASVYQVHSATAVVAEPWPVADRPHADALVTDRPGLLLGIVTADCAPVLLADADARVIGAAHAGRKGAVGGIVEATVSAMTGLGARTERMVAAIGPCIAQRSYEVDNSFADKVPARFLAPARLGHALFDLEGYVADRLAAAGVTSVDRLGLDTYADAARFFSYRRATHRGEIGYGRQLALIGLEDQ